MMADVSVQNERNNGSIPSSATNVIMNWLEWIKTQPHDDRDNCFQHLVSKGPCGMTVNNDINDDSATKHSDSHITSKEDVLRFPPRPFVPDLANVIRRHIILNVVDLFRAAYMLTKTSSHR